MSMGPETPWSIWRGIDQKKNCRRKKSEGIDLGVKGNTRCSIGAGGIGMGGAAIGMAGAAELVGGRRIRRGGLMSLCCNES
jgi:hypothetical protein